MGTRGARSGLCGIPRCAAVMWPPRSFTACNSLPPEGVAAPAVWLSQSRGPGGNKEPLRSLAARSSLPLEGAAAPAVWLNHSCSTCWNGEPLRSLAASSSLHLKGASAPAARQSRFRVPRLDGEAALLLRTAGCALSPTNCLFPRKRVGAERFGSQRGCPRRGGMKKFGLRPDCGLRDGATRAFFYWCRTR